MRASRWVLICTVGGVLIGSCAAVLLFRTQVLAGVEMATTGKMTTTAVKPSRPAVVREAQVRHTPPAAPAPAASAAPRRIETTMYDAWAVTCEDVTVNGTAKKSCGSSLRVTNQNRVLLNWQIGFNEAGHLVTAVQVPIGLAIKQGDKTVGGAILIPNGVDLKFGNGAVRHLTYMWCGPRQCSAEAPIDEAFIKDAAANTKATITIHTSGGAIPFDLPIKGIDKAIAYAHK